MFYIIGFTFAVGWVSRLVQDKPWLLVVLGGSALFGSILALLFILQEAQLYNGWDILFTGGFYFSKNKIFGTIGEAQAHGARSTLRILRANSGSHRNLLCILTIVEG